MSAFMRIDNRLIHGQIIATWMPSLQVEHFLIASDTVPRNEMQMRVFRMAVPSEIEFEALSIREAAAWLKAHNSDKQRTMVLLENVQDAISLFGAGYSFTQLNIGNVHHSEDRKPFTNAVYLSDREISLLKQLIRRKVKVEIASLPTDTPINLAETL